MSLLRVLTGPGLCLALLCGCMAEPTTVRKPAPQTEAGGGWLAAAPAEKALPGVLKLPQWPASNSQIRTTSATIYLGNLDARIAQLQQGEHEPAVAQALASSLLHRYRISGQLVDAERAGALLQAQLQGESVSAGLRAAYAQWLVLFHRFAEAQAQLEQLGSTEDSTVAALREEINLALGHYAALGPAFARPADHAPPDPYALASRAHAALLHGDLDLASRLYFEAQSNYHDVGPYPLAWLHVQQGIALLRHGHCEAAEPFFRAARERLPAYYLATEHLAECLVQMRRIEEARGLYEEVIAQTGNPEFMAALADLEEIDGRPERAALLRLQADQTWAGLLQAHPEAYAQHAAEYYLATGRLEPAALWAGRNLAMRQDIGSRLLMVELALARQDRANACDQLRSAQDLGLRPPELVELQALAACP